MSLTNVEKSAPSGERTLPKKGPRPAILTGIIDVGVHVREYKGEKKKPARQFIPVFTLTKDTYEVEGEGAKQIRIQPFPLNVMPGATRGTYFNFIKALDPEGEVMPGGAGNITDLLGRGCFLMVGHTDPKGDDGVVYPRIEGYSALPEDYSAGETDGKTLFFDLDNPDREVFQAFPDFIKAFIRSSVDYVGSKLEEQLEGGEGGTPAPKVSDDDTPDEDEDSPV